MRKMVLPVLTAVVLALLIPRPVPTAALEPARDGLIKSVRYLPLTPWEESVKTKKISAYSGYSPNAVYADRKVYWRSDWVGQFLVTFLNADFQGKQMQLELLSAGQPPQKFAVGPMTQPKAALLLGVGALKPGKYTLRASLPAPAALPPVEVEFEVADQAQPVVPFPPEGLEIRVDPQAQVKDGRWPICTGVPFPEGTMPTLTGLELEEDGRPIPSQIEKVATWHPEDEKAGIGSSISWARLSFVARYVNGQPSRYVLKKGPPRGGLARPIGPMVSAVKNGDQITVDNGMIKFQVNTKHFRGIDLAWFDPSGRRDYTAARKVLDNTTAPGGGAYIVDAAGNTYQAANAVDPEVEIEEAGPIRCVIAAQGWYTRQGEDGAAPGTAPGSAGKLCLFRTRIIAYAGEPMLRVYHHTILTFDSNKVQLADVGFRIGVPAADAGKWSMGADGKAISDQVPPAGSVYMHQYRWNKLRIEHDAGHGDPDALEKARPQPESIPGQKSDGWFTITGKAPGTPAVTVLVRDFWQKFPKEMEIDKAGFDLHFWPRHGIETWNKAEILDPKDIYKLWWYEQGKLLDLHFPTYVYDELVRLHKGPGPMAGWDVEHMVDQAKEGNAQGAAIGNEYILRFHDPAVNDQQAQAALFQRDPHAISDPRWNARTLVEGEISACDPRKFPKLEEDINTFFPDYLKAIVDAGTEYGMWTYADVHDSFEAGSKASALHRVWSASHYRNVSTPWLLYFRGSSPDNLVFAAANTDHYMDVDTVNYTKMVPTPAPANAPANGALRPEFKAHTPGAMYHAKGFTPWGSAAYGGSKDDVYVSHWGHFVNPDAFRYRYLLEGNGRALDLYKLWAGSMKSFGMFPGVTREQIGIFGEMLSYYTTTWDPDILPMLNAQEAAVLAHPMDQWPVNYDHPGWHRFWHSRDYDLTRDPRILPAVVEYCKGFGQAKPLMLTWAYMRTGDKKYLDVIMPLAYDLSLAIYRNPDDPLSGARPRFAAYEMFYYQEMPYFIAALNKAGINDITPGALGRTIYPNHSTHTDFNSEKSPAVTLLALKPEDREFTLHLESLPGRDTTEPVWRIFSPSGKMVIDRPTPTNARQTRYNGDKALVQKVPKDGETGLYRFDFRSYDLIAMAPYTDLPVEGTLMDPAVPYNTAGRVETYLQPVGERAKIQITWRQRRQYPRIMIAYIRLEDAKGNILLDTSLLGGGLRDNVACELDTAKNPGPYHLFQYSSGGTTIKWSGNAKGVITGSTPQQVKDLTKALETPTR